MRGLFWRIFLWFWVASVLVFVVTSWSTAQLYRSAASAWADRLGEGGLQALADGAVERLERSGALAAYRWLAEHTPARPPPRFVLLGPDGAEVAGAPLPEPLARLARHIARGGQVHVDALPMPAARAVGPSGRSYLLLALPPRPPGAGPPWRPFPEFTAVRIVTALALSALMCLVLARYLARPVRQLGAAIARVAEGDLSARAAPEIGPRGDELGKLGRAFDDMAARLEAMLEAQRRLLRDVSHELRSPLARIRLAAALAAQRGGGDVAPELARIEAECSELDGLIDEILTLARLEAAIDGERREPVALGSLVGEVADDAGFEAEAAGCRLEVDCRLEGAVALGQREWLRRALENVLRNAMAHAPSGTAVRLRAEVAADGAALIEVEDRGPGVSPAELGRLFEPFTRGAASQASPGYGLGLAIARRVVEAHGGSIRAALGEGGGLVVAIRLPLARGGG